MSKEFIYYIHLYQDAVLKLPVHGKHEGFFLFLRRKWTGFISTTLFEEGNNSCISAYLCIDCSEKGMYRKIFFLCEYSILDDAIRGREFSANAERNHLY